MGEQRGPERAERAERAKLDGDAGQVGGQAAPPLFYKDPQPLNADLHGGKGLKDPPNHRFAAAAHAVVLLAEEFRLAAAYYPIVFADDESATVLAVTGYRDGHNAFVDAAGQWAARTYVPAYVRRYPFATGAGANPDEPILYIDAASDLIVDLADSPGAQPLFQDREPSERTKQAIAFCAAFQQQIPPTRAFAEAVVAHGLLDSKEVNLDLPGGGRQRLTGLRIIDEARFNALPDGVFLDWRRKGWVALVYWHWASMDNFRRLVERG